MSLLQIPSQTITSPSSTLHRSGKLTGFLSHRAFSANGDSRGFRFRGLQIRKRGSLVRIEAMADQAVQKMNMNEYMVTLERPLGIRFALSVDGRIYVHSMQRGGNAEKSRIIMVGDTLKKASGSANGSFVEIKDLQDTQNMIKEASGPCSIVLERPGTPFPINELPLNAEYSILFNKGRVPLTTWNNKVVKASCLESTYDENNSENLSGNGNGNGSAGFVIFSPKLLSPGGWALLSGERNGAMKSSKANVEIIATLAEKEGVETDWSYGDFPLEEYIKALDRGRGELYYNHLRGMQYSKVTEQIYVGSCLQTEKDVEALANDVGITAVLHFQSDRERINWGIDSGLINQSCKDNNILMINYPIRDGDSTDLRKKLPFCVGLLLRLLRKKYRIYVTCTTGFDRSPTCVVAYLHWIQDTALHTAYNYITGTHASKPDRAAVVWATWDLIAMAENRKLEGPPTHCVTFFWNNSREGEEVLLVGDFTNNWKDTIPLIHNGGTRHEAEIRLRHGKYLYKFIVGNQWRHSTSLPTEHDERGNINNVIRVGDIAQIRPSPSHLRISDPTDVKVVERALTEDERFLLAFAARRITFAICPLRLSPKQ